jgi:hypothetical protein
MGRLVLTGIADVLLGHSAVGLYHFPFFFRLPLGVLTNFVDLGHVCTWLRGSRKECTVQCYQGSCRLVVSIPVLCLLHEDSCP